MGWSKYQDAIYDFVQHGQGNLVVVARAGSGKTTTICEACNRIPKGKRVLVCAFNNKIRDELTARLSKLRHVTVKGLHQMGLGAMMRYRGGKLSVERYRVSDYIRRLIPDEYKDYRGDVIKLVSMCMANLAVTEERVVATMYAYDLLPTAPRDVPLYVQWALAALAFSEKPSSAISFDEQIYLPARFNLSTGSYDVVLVDEAQDLNACQYRLALNAVRPGGRIIAVGDDRQAIYAFRGADSDALGRMKRELNATVLPLSVTYRCPQSVVRLAQNIVEDFEAGEDNPEGRVLIVNEKTFLDGVAPGDAVISRTNAALMKYCMALLVRGKRARIVGKDLSAKLDSLLSRTTTTQLAPALKEMAAYVDEEAERLEAAKKEDKAEELRDNLEAIQAISSGLSSVNALRSKLSALFAEDESGRDYGTIPCMTVHKAKGLEFDHVWMLESTFRIGSVEGANLYYVAVTRAKSQLCLVQVPRSDGKEVPSIALTELQFKPTA